jgi:hypothetical protein
MKVLLCLLLAMTATMAAPAPKVEVIFYEMSL